MPGVATGVIAGHTAAGIVYTINFQFPSADAVAAQTTVNSIKAFLASGSTIDSVNVNFVPQSTALT